MQVCTSLLTDNHASTPLLSFYRPDALPATQPTASKHFNAKAFKELKHTTTTDKHHVLDVLTDDGRNIKHLLRGFLLQCRVPEKLQL